MPERYALEAEGEPEGEEPAPKGAGSSSSSMLSWNTSLSRTSVSSLSTAAFSDHSKDLTSYGLQDVFQTVRNLSLRYTAYQDIERQGPVGTGETFLVERCQVKGETLAIKFLKFNGSPDSAVFQRRIKSIVLELRIMRHEPLRAHPSIPEVIGYGWPTRGPQAAPYLLMEYAPYGTFRQHLQSQGPTLTASHKEILLGDVASAIEALHSCQIIHGDIKLDNVLLFHSWERPTKIVAKLSDFGHSLVIPGQGQQGSGERTKYGGTRLYDAPEVLDQEYFPIEPQNLTKCDIWAFGLLVWETFLNGDIFKNHVEAVSQSEDCAEIALDATQLLESAKRSIPFGRHDLQGNLIRLVLNKTLQADPSKRPDSIDKIPFLSQWHGGFKRMEAHLALHLRSSEFSYEMFRQDNRREMLWNHELQTFQQLLHNFSQPASRHRDGIWQLALAYRLGFGTSPDHGKASQLSSRASVLRHPVATIFPILPGPRHLASDEKAEMSYAMRVSTLLQQSAAENERCQLMKECAATQSPVEFAAFESRFALAADGLSILHLLLMAESSMSAVSLENIFRTKEILPVDQPTTAFLEVHPQWPLRLSGSPLAFSIAVNCNRSVKMLLSLGADPHAAAFAPNQFPLADCRSSWTPFHMAVQYHCHEILDELLTNAPDEYRRTPIPLACALAYSTTLEREAMHGGAALLALEKTVAAVARLEPLDAATPDGETALMKAIDFHNTLVVSALLKANPSLCHTPMRNPSAPHIYNLPLHWASQIGARRDVPETLNVLNLIDEFGASLSLSEGPIRMRDSSECTPLHLAVTGMSTKASEWLLSKDPDMLLSRDEQGRFPLHYCKTADIGEFLL